MIRTLAAAVLTLPLATAAAQTEIPQSAFGIEAHTPVEDLPVRHYNATYNLHLLEAVPVPLDGPWRYGVVPGAKGEVCEVVADTLALAPTRAGALKARLYLHLSGRHGPPWKTGRSPPADIWAPQDGSAARISLMLMRAPGEQETVFVQYSFFGPGKTLCYPGQR